jgi:lysozyme
LSADSNIRRSARAVPVLVAIALLFGVAAPARAESLENFAREGTMLGIDVSKWQGAPKWWRVRDAGVEFVIARATITTSNGKTVEDPEYLRNRWRAAKLGIPFTAYHYAQPRWSLRSAIRQADRFVDAARLRPGHLVPVLDLEQTGGLGSTRLIKWVRTWLAQVETRIGVKPMIYVNPSFWTERMADTRWFARHGYRLWIAHWKAPNPRVPAGNWAGHGWTLWQRCDCGRVTGISGPVDVDLLNGTSVGKLRIRNNRQ